MTMLNASSTRLLSGERVRSEPRARCWTRQFDATRAPDASGHSRSASGLAIVELVSTTLRGYSN